MTLTDADMLRLEQAGHLDFFDQGRDGSCSLRNVNGHCTFLCERGCSVYRERPEGCELYPLVLDTDDDRVVLHDFCPYRKEFHFTDDDRRRLRRSITTEEQDTARRRARGR